LRRAADPENHKWIDGGADMDSEGRTFAYPEKVSALLDEGQSLWLDTLSRDLMDSGELSRLIHSVGIRGITSNPAIFEKAVSGSRDYDEEIRQLAGRGASPEDILRRLMTEDVRRACDLFLPVFRSTEGEDGFVSIEVRPLLADRAEDSVEEARRLHKMVDRPNLFIKIPGTEAGFPAIRELVSEGISVNVTLLFSPGAYRKSALAYIDGLESFVSKGKDPSLVTSVASLFVSRLDTLIDREFDEVCQSAVSPLLSERARTLRGKAGIANARIVYQIFREIFARESFARLSARGARLQRPLWASTGTKNPEYSDVLYVESLIGPDTVDTLPIQTLDAFLDHGTVRRSIDMGDMGTSVTGADSPQSVLDKISRLGLSVESVYSRLLQEGIAGFDTSYQNLLARIVQKSGGRV
jgi:transaldolase/glucose-6-phosphate isomerase